MQILVTGAGGFLGNHLVERLLAHGHNHIRCLLRDRTKAAHLADVCAVYPQAQLEFVFGNLRSPEVAAQATAGIDLIFHLAAAMKGSPADMFLDSVVASRNLVQAIAPRAASVRIVLISSFAVYGVAEMRRGTVVNEHTELETHPEWRDPYSHSKLRQEQLFWEYRKELGFQLVVARPGVIYGPGGPQMSSRVGLNLFGVFLHLGGSNLIPLSYVDNCAEALVLAGTHMEADGEVFNIHDDDLPTSSQYLRQYRQSVSKLRSIHVPYPAMMVLSRAVRWYHKRSKGQLPAVFTPYKTKTTWGGNKFDNAKLKAIGWRQVVSTEEGMRQAFESFRSEKR